MQVAQSLSAQRKAVFTFFDGDWNRTEDTNKAKYFKRLQKQDGKKWQLDYYNFAGPMIKTETVTDKNATTKDGRYASYHPSGYVDSAGEFVNNNHMANGVITMTREKPFFEKHIKTARLLIQMIFQATEFSLLQTQHATI